MRCCESTDRAAGRCAHAPVGLHVGFPELTELAAVLRAHRAIMDGELGHLGPDGKPDFAAISRRLIGRGRTAADAVPAAMFVAFDLLHLEGRAVRALPYGRRRESLHELLGDGPRWRVPRPLAGPLDAVLTVTRDAHLERVVAKRLSAPYEAGPAVRRVAQARAPSRRVVRGAPRVP